MTCCAQDPTTGTAIRVVIAEDNPAMRDTLARAVARPEDVDVVAAVATADGLRAAVDEHEPDVVLLDLRLGDDWGFDLVPELRSRPAAPEVVVLSAMAGERTEGEFERSGAFRQLVKGCRLEEIHQAVADAARARR